jgi:hypothetical protein
VTKAGRGARRDDAYAEKGGERPVKAGTDGAGAARSARVSGDGRDSGGVRKMGAEAGGKMFATAHDAQACSFCGTKGA